ncbi:MAG TPA: hypothetical protein VKE41_15495 [Roseiflexaceae bacterium]|nr:hypothetical protein [Roseiflexaceae bacterium]
MTTATRNSRGNVTVSSRAMQQAAAAAESALAPKVTAADVKAEIEARLQAALDEATARRADAELAEPELPGRIPWWDLIAVGPIQPGAGTLPAGGSPLLPHGIIRSGETAFIATILILNPVPHPALGGMSPCDFLSMFSLPYEVTYQTGNLTEWKKGPASLNVESDPSGNLVPGVCFYVDILEFEPYDLDEVLYEMNISARIFGCSDDPAISYAPPFAGFAREVVDIDPDLFSGAPGLGDRPIRFMVYGPTDGK